MKRSFSILLITALLVALMPLMSTVALAEEYATITSENGYGVRLREGPSKAYNPLGTFDVGTTVNVLQRGDEWSQLQIGDTVGWMMNQYLIFGTSGITPGGTGTANATVYSDNGLRVWLRATPGGTRLFLNSAGTGVTVLSQGDEWCKVSINGTIGYMMTKYIAFEKIDPADYEIESATINYYYPVVGDTLMVELEPSSATVTYEWYVDGSLLGTEETFEVLTRYANQTIKVKVTGTGDYYGSAVDTAYPVQINRGIKSVALSQSVPVVGETLEAVLQPTSARVDYSWRVGGVEVSREATYTPSEGDIGKLIQLKVTGIDGFSGSAACTAEHVVTSDKVVQYVELDNEHPIVGDVMTAKVYPSSADVNITWYADGEAVSFTSSYKVDKRDLGKKIKVVVEGVDPYSGTAMAVSYNVASSEIAGVSLPEESPLLGDTLTAKIEPSNAIAYYYWYTDEDVLIHKGNSSSITLTDRDLIGKKIWVKAEGDSVYTGSADSNLTGEVIDNMKITAVAIDNITPVVGDILTVTIAPQNTDMTAAEYEAYRAKQTYIWYADNEIKTGDDHQYTVQFSDIDKRIRVKVIGANGYSGEAYSTYTERVEEYGELTKAHIYNETAEENATSHAPEVGHTLTASVSPVGANDFVTYKWYVDDKPIKNATGDSLTIDKKWVGKSIKVEAIGEGRYKDSDPVYATTKAVADREALKAMVRIEAPKAGITPSSSVYCYDEDDGKAYKDFDECKASIEWLGYNKETAILDAYGCFLPNEQYIAKVTIQPKDSDVTLFGAVDVQFITPDGGVISNSDVEHEDGSSVFYVSFSTGTLTVNDCYIADLEPPVVGGTLDTECGNDQIFSTGVTWSYNDGEYTACIRFDTKPGFTVNGLTENVFTVAGADETIYTAGTKEIWAVYKMEHEFVIQSDKEEVYLDGYNRRIVQCSAHLSNYIGKLENIQWEIVDAHVDGTSIDNNGQLIIGMHELTERELTVRATAIVNGEEYVAEKTIYIYSGTDTDTELKVVFTKYNAEITYGGHGYFEAVVSNSSDGCTLFALFEDGTSSKIEDGWLHIGADLKDDEYVIVKAISNEDHSVTGTMLVTLIGETNGPSIEFTHGADVVAPGDEELYTAVAYWDDKEEQCNSYSAVWPDGTEEPLAGGKLKVDQFETRGMVTIKATYTVNSTVLSATKNVTIEVPQIEFDPATRNAVGRYESGVTFEAFAKFENGDQACEIFADFGDGNGYQPLMNGVLVFPNDFDGESVKIRAEYGALNSETLVVKVTYPAIELRIEGPDTVEEGSQNNQYTGRVMNNGQPGVTVTLMANRFGQGFVEMTGGVLDASALTAGDQVIIKAVYRIDEKTELTTTKTVDVVAPMMLMAAPHPLMTLDLYGEEDSNIAIDEMPETIATEEPVTEEEPAVEEPSAEEPAAEEETDDTIVIEVDTEEPVVEEETAEEEASAEEPAAEEETDDTIVIEVDTEEPVVEEEPTAEEETDDTIVIEVDTEEPVVEEEPAEEETTAEEETDDTIVIEVDTSEPVVEEETEEVKPEEELTGVVLSIKDTITGELIEEVVVEEEPEEEIKEDKKNSKSSKKGKKDQPAEEEAEEIEEDETLDALEGDDIGESAESESTIKISFTKRANKIRLGYYSTFVVNVTGSDQGVIWSLRLSEDVNGEPVSSIDQDGRLAVSLDEKAEKLIVVATSREDRSVRARWIVEVTEGEDEEEVIVEETTEESVTTTEEIMTDEDAMAEAAMAEENNSGEEPVEENAESEEGNFLLNMF